MCTQTVEVHAVKQVVDVCINSLNPALQELNRQIWSNPELAYEEHKAHDAICDFLEKQGFAVTRHAYGLDTAFEALSGSGGRLINFNAEYDALPGIGHACGHNLIATSSIGAFLALSTTLKKLGIPGRTQLLGTPAEEIGGGKIKLIEAGAYKGVDISLMAHPIRRKIFPGVESDGVAGVLMNARDQILCEFRGKNAHAGGNPWDGINALDALVTSYNNVSMLRQQIHPQDRVHCAFLETPKAPNVIADYSKAVWQVRSPTLRGLDLLKARVTCCLEAAAQATGCEVTLQRDDYDRYADVKINDTLCERYQIHMGTYGRDVTKSHSEVLTGSSDIGNVSYLMPTLHSLFSIPTPDGIFPHHPSFTANAGSKAGCDEAILVAKSLALTGWDMIVDDNLFLLAVRQWKEQLEN